MNSPPSAGGGGGIAGSDWRVGLGGFGDEGAAKRRERGAWWIQAIAPSDWRMRLAAFAAEAATKRHQSVPLKIKTAPSSRKASGLCWEAPSTNCGRKARKNSATLGLSTLVSAPCQNTDASEAAPPVTATSVRGRERDSS